MDGNTGVVDGIVVDGNTEVLKVGGLRVNVLRVDGLVLKVVNMADVGGMAVGGIMVSALVGDLPL